MFSIELETLSQQSRACLMRNPGNMLKKVGELAFSNEFNEWVRVYDPEARFSSINVINYHPINYLITELPEDRFMWSDSDFDKFSFTIEEILLLFKLTWC